MKTCFSTLGCPDWSLEDIISCAKDLRYDAVEIRGIKNELFVPNIPQFLAENAAQTKDKFEKKGIAIACLDSACYLHLADRDYVGEAKQYIDCASRLGVPYVRVLGDRDPQPGDAVDEERVKAALRELDGYADGKDVMVLVETNGVFADTARLRALLDGLQLSHTGILWDVHHPYRYFGEAPEKTYEHIAPYLRHVHIKDSTLEEGTVRYKMIGHGDLPLVGCLSVLKKHAYEGCLSLEWVKRWYQDLEHAGVAFAQYRDAVDAMWKRA